MFCPGALSQPLCLPLPLLCSSPAATLPLAEPLDDADEPLVPPALARAPPLAEPLTLLLPVADPEPAVVPDVVFVFCEADVD